ncbi:GIY-YIG nuclease family protein [Fodinibius halophilus]|uniref:GIY-YIG nuclease family protein n=1 Tax=Fodinibius halophilus TaxID=1736908 RepID=A0A6M1T6P5_9BACT|nr:GIY-YIG nuclease family protein [Fodinibius halophilus]NGP89779.1 GIY-YIG nuclease family protein [Fodinibius halophilus]
MYYVYILKSKNRDWRYIGYTKELKERFAAHNAESVQSTKHYAPFTLEAYVAVQTKRQARELEKYFKTGSGRSVLMKRILQST